MGQLSNALENFRAAVINEANREKAELEKEIAAIENQEMDNIENQALFESYSKIRTEMGRIINAANEKISQKTIEIRKEILLKREQIKQNIFNKVKSNITEFVKTENYNTYFNEILSSIKDKLGEADDLHVEISPVDSAKSHTIKAKLGEGIIITENPEILGGIIVYSKKLGKYINKTFNAKLDEEMEYFISTCKFRDN